VSSVGALIKVSGVVQGVGYRYFAIHSARTLGVTGWVRNNDDSSVSVLAEGERGIIEVLVKELTTGPAASNVTNVNIQWQEYTGQFTGFDVSW
jgi:acylphosphatase